MNEIAIYIFLMAASVAFWLWEAWYSRKESQMKIDDLGNKLEEVLVRHCDDEYSIFSMNCLKVNKDCAGVLRGLRPGDPVSLQRRFSDDKIIYDVFAIGRLVGSLSEQSSEVIEIIVKDYRILGSYIWTRDDKNRDTDSISIMVCYNFDSLSVSDSIEGEANYPLSLSSLSATMPFELN